MLPVSIYDPSKGKTQNLTLFFHTFSIVERLGRKIRVGLWAFFILKHQFINKTKNHEGGEVFTSWFCWHFKKIVTLGRVGRATSVATDVAG